jgi:hypothetical protein
MMINWEDAPPAQFKTFTGKTEVDALNKIVKYFDDGDIEADELKAAQKSPKKLLTLIEDCFGDGYDTIFVGKVTKYKATK